MSHKNRSKSPDAGAQHYVPQFLLRNFCQPKKQQCFVFDKYTARVFTTNVRNVASERGYHDFAVGDFMLSVDPLLKSLEAFAAKAIHNIVRDETLATLTDDSRAVIAQFVVVQMARATHTRARLLELSRAIEQELRSRGIDPDTIENFERATPQDAKLLSIIQILDSDEYIPYIYEKDWLLFRASRSNPLFISDNPVARQNLRERGPHGNLGLGVPGIEVYLPISKTLSLVFLCQSWGNTCRLGIEKYRRVHLRNPSLPNLDLSPLEELLKAIESGEPLACDPQNVENMNSLQVRNAERFVFSSTDDFSLVRSMLAKSDKYKHGPRLKVF